MQRWAKDILEANDIHVHFGGVRALSGVNLKLERKTILGLIGPNGAGKTTMVNVLSGFQKPNQGDVKLDGAEISALPPRKIARAGIGRSFQSARVFRDLTIEQNLAVAGLGIGLSKKDATEQARDILNWMGLHYSSERRCDSLPYSDERRVSIARALALQPSFALLDEPASGMNDRECEKLMEIIIAIPTRFDCGVMLIEHNMQVIMGVCERIHVLDGGRSLAEGNPKQISQHPDVLRAYLGDGASRTGAMI